MSDASPGAAARSRFNPSRWAIEHPALTRYLLIVLMLLGGAAYTQLGQDEDPPFTLRVMIVRAFWPGASAQQMAEQVADRIEKTLQEVTHADVIRSFDTALSGLARGADGRWRARLERGDRWAELWAGEVNGHAPRPFVLSGRGEGRLSWYVDGAPCDMDDAGEPVWSPGQPGFYTVTAVDPDGRASRVRVRVVTGPA